MANYNPTKTKREAAKLLRQAAKLIETFGHLRASGGNEQKGFCLLEAMSKARCGDSVEWPNISVNDIAFRALQKTTQSSSVYGWNDFSCGGKDDAVRMLRKTSRALEHGLEVK